MTGAYTCTVEIEVSFLGLVHTIECCCKVTGASPATWDDPADPGDFELVSAHLVTLSDAGLEQYTHMNLDPVLVDDVYGPKIRDAVNRLDRDELLPWERDPDDAYDRMRDMDLDAFAMELLT